MNVYRMGGRKQKISKDTYLQKASAEHRGYAKGLTSIWITENNTVTPPEDDGMLGRILNPYNLNRAYLKVGKNKGSFRRLSTTKWFQPDKIYSSGEVQS